VLTRRLIVCLDVKGGRVVKGVNFVGLRDVGDPVALATRYEAEGADEITFLDISASAEDRATLLDVAKRTAERLFIPLTIGGGVRTADDVGRALRAGADKVSLNSAMVADPTVLTACADRFGAQCVVASIDAKLDETGGAGEVLLTSIDRDGARTGYDLPLMRAVSTRVAAPVIASGGAGNASHIVDVLAEGHADAALVAGILHDNLTTVGALKDAMRASGLVVR
jgi:imidazole glycerol-phosphate synthase subunit HisF